MSQALIWPAAERNKGPILEVLQDHLPAQGTVLEIASGTGQHVVHFAAALPHLQWQPSDPDTSHRDSIRAAVAQAQLHNVFEPLDLDVCSQSYPPQSYAAVFVANLLHIAPPEVLPALADCVSQVLLEEGVLLVYGPFKVNGRFSSVADEAFDQTLRERDPSWGIRELDEILQVADQHQLSHLETISMPANNYLLRFRQQR